MFFTFFINYFRADFWIFDRNQSECITEFDDDMKCHFYFALCHPLPQIGK